MSTRSLMSINPPPCSTRRVDGHQRTTRSSYLLHLPSGLESELSIPAHSLTLMNLTGEDRPAMDGVLNETQTLADMGVGAGAKVGIELRINYYQDRASE